MFDIKEVKAHCDIPCKIYDPATAQIAALSIIRLLDLIAELGDPLKSVADAAQLVRLTEQRKRTQRVLNTMLLQYGEITLKGHK